MADVEIDEGIGYARFVDALQAVHDNVHTLDSETRPLAACPGYVASESALALFDSPSRDVSQKDGFAVNSVDVANAYPERPIRLELMGAVFAGGMMTCPVGHGQAVRVLTGASIPDGADAVVAGELCDESDGVVRFRAGARKGQNIARVGSDMRAGAVIVEKGQLLTPGRLASAAVSGIHELQVFRKPRVAILSIGDELIAPGSDRGRENIYASNSIYIGAWLSCCGVPFVVDIARDDEDEIARKLKAMVLEADAIVTTGGAMHSERDLIVGVLDRLGWNIAFRHVRMSPGKGTSFGVWQGKPVFCLSGSPGASVAAFVELVLPGIVKICGFSGRALQEARATLKTGIRARGTDWTEFREGQLVRDADGSLVVTVVSEKSRSRAMAEADCFICKPEGADSLQPGQVTVQLLSPVFPGAL